MKDGDAVRLTRTSGDGMENKDKDEIQNSSVEEKLFSNKRFHKINLQKADVLIPGLNSIYRPNENSAFRYMPHYVPKGKLCLLKPKLIVTSKNTDEHKKTRLPKFVPFEPYSAAVNFIVKPKKYNNKHLLKANRNKLDINILVSQMSNMKSTELQNKNSEISQTQNEKSEECKEIKKLTEERDYFQSQLKFQIQINSELKNLLVAAVGEDLETKVNVLTEDKLQLARALLDSANNLSTHTEQIEFLAGQCEVWRSKFLSSSVMIEELARLKAELTRKNSLLTNSTQQLLDLTMQIREMQMELLKNLKFLANLKSLNLRSYDIYTLAAECVDITQQMVLHSGVGMPNNLIVNNCNILTETEKLSIKSLDIVRQPLLETDETFKAIMNQAKRNPALQFNTKNATDF